LVSKTNLKTFFKVQYGRLMRNMLELVCVFLFLILLKIHPELKLLVAKLCMLGSKLDPVLTTSKSTAIPSLPLYLELP